MKQNAKCAAKWAGFTLIELLIVIAIVAALAAILLPVFATVRERGRRTVCQSNLKLLALAMQQYVQDNSGVYPLAIGSVERDGVAYEFDWSQAVFPYVKDGQVFVCPDMPADAPWQSGSVGDVGSPPHTDYTYDSGWLNVFLPPYPTKNVQGARESMLATPSSIRLNEDAVWITPDGVWHNGRPGPQSSCGREGGGSTLHSGGGNYSFVDGHVKWLTPEEAGEVECANGPPPAPFK